MSAKLVDITYSIPYYTVLQFTLCYVLKGNKPDFHNAMMGDLSKPMYEQFLTQLGDQYKPDAIKGESNISAPPTVMAATQVAFLELT